MIWVSCINRDGLSSVCSLQNSWAVFPYRETKLYPISINLQCKSMSESFHIFCLSVNVTADKTHYIFGKIFESLVHCVTAFHFWFFAVYTAGQTLDTNVLCVFSSLGMWPTLHSCTRGNILTNSVQKWLPYMIFPVLNWLAWDTKITPFLHLLPWCSQKLWMKVQDLDHVAQMLISLGYTIWKPWPKL